MALKNARIKAILLIAITLILNSNSIAQAKYYKGYVILLNADTLKGEIRINPKHEIDNYSKVAYRKSEGVEMKNFNPTKILEYFVNGTYYVSRNVDGEQIFIKRLSKGAVNLYELQLEVVQMNDIKVKSDFYMEKANVTGPVRIKSGKFKKQVEEAMSDNQEILKGLENKTYDFENIVEVFDAYNKSTAN